MSKMTKKILSAVLSATLLALPAVADTQPKKKTFSGPLASALIKEKSLQKKDVLNKRGLRKNVPVSPIADAPENMPMIYGVIDWNTKIEQGSALRGLYDIPLNGDQDPGLLIDQEIGASGGGVYKDGLFYCTDFEVYFGDILIHHFVVDVASRAIVSDFWDDEIESIGVAGYALDPTDGQIYGITYDWRGEDKQLTKIDFTTSSVSCTEVAALEGSWSACFFDENGQLYGISTETVGQDDTVISSRLNKIDKLTGEVTPVGGLTGAVPEYISGIVYDPQSRKCYWNVCPSDNTGWMYELDITTGEATPLYQLKYNDQITGLFIPEGASGAVPGVCTDMAIDFSGDSLSGTVSLMAPINNADGQPGTGMLTVTLMMNDLQVGEKTMEYGDDVAFNVIAPQAGKYDFKATASNAAGQGASIYARGIWIGPDEPAAPAAALKYENGNMIVTWDAVQGSVNNGYIDLDALTYKVVRYQSDNETPVTVATGLTGLSFTEAIAIPDNLTTYSYGVYASAGGVTSAEGRTNSVGIGYLNVPYEHAFNSYESTAGYTIINANNDDETWKFMPIFGGLSINYNEDLDMDDWVVTPGVRLTAGVNYDISIVTMNQSTVWGEKIEVKAGTSPTAQALTTTVIAPSDVKTDKKPLTLTGVFSPEADGIYYFGFHGISPKDNLYLQLMSWSIQYGVANSAPGAPTEMTVTPGANKALTATVTFKAPALTLVGDPLQSLDKVEIYRGETLVKTFDNPAPGAELSYEDTVERPGNFTYKALGYNAAGRGLETEATAYIGVQRPGEVNEPHIKCTDVVGEVTVSWNAVTVDALGQYLAPEHVTYSVYEVDGDGLVKRAEGLTTLSFTYQAVESGEQRFVQCAVYARTAAGYGEEDYTEMIPVGTPFDGMHESFANGRLQYPFGMESVNGGSVRVMTDSSISGLTASDGDGGYLAISGAIPQSGAGLYTGLVSLEGMSSPSFKFSVYNVVSSDGQKDNNTIGVSVRVAGETQYTEVMAPTSVWQLVSAPNAWGQVTVPLDAYSGKVVQVMITAITNTFLYTALDNFIIGSGSGVAGITEGEATVTVDGRVIKVLGAEGMEVSIADINGTLLYAGAGKPEIRVPAYPGVFVVRTGATLKKIMVK